MSKVFDNIDLRLQAEPRDGLVLVNGSCVQRITREVALALAKRYSGDYYLIVRGSKIRKMVQIEKPPPEWQKGYRTERAVALSPWPGWHLRYE